MCTDSGYIESTSIFRLYENRWSWIKAWYLCINCKPNLKDILCLLLNFEEIQNNYKWNIEKLAVRICTKFLIMILIPNVNHLKKERCLEYFRYFEKFSGQLTIPTDRRMVTDFQNFDFYKNLAVHLFNVTKVAIKDIGI